MSTHIRDILNIDGYYTASHSHDNLMFFEDGIINVFYFKKSDNVDSIKTNMHKWANNQISWGTNWGVYRIEGDTIIGQFFWQGGILSTPSIFEYRYKIIDKKTIKKIYYKSLRKIDEKYYQDNKISTWKDGDIYKYVPTDTLPSSDCWLKEEKWIWRNESDWKDYMEKIKQKQKK